MVVSGINLGANMGDDTIYSGTVAAATEGYLGVPSIAVSLCSKAGAHFETAARVALEVVEMVRQQAAQVPPLLLNVNVPDVPYERVRGRLVTRLGKRHKAEAIVKAITPRNETVYWVGAAGEGRMPERGTGFPRRRQRLRLDHAVADRPDA